MGLIGSTGSGSFNGATAFQPWRLRAGLERAKADGKASMGPQLFSRGDIAN